MSAPRFVRPLTKAEQVEIARLVRRGRDGRLVRRALMVQMSAKGQKAGAIAETLSTSVPTVHRTLKAFNSRGLDGLPDAPRSGRPPKASERYVECLKEAVATSPIDYGYVFTSWTLPRLREHLARRCRVVLHPDYLGRLMAKHGIVYRRPRHVMGHLQDPQEYEEKKALLAFLKKTRSTGGTISISSSSTNRRFTSTPR